MAAYQLRQRRPKKADRFWDRFGQAQLMLWRLNDAELDSTWCRRASAPATNKYDACCLIYIGIVGLACKSLALEHRGFEIDAHWRMDFDSLERHFDQHLVGRLKEVELDAFHGFALAAAKAAIREPENLFAYARSAQ